MNVGDRVEIIKDYHFSRRYGSLAGKRGCIVFMRANPYALGIDVKLDVPRGPQDRLWFSINELEVV